MNQSEELTRILEQHARWLASGEKSGSRADLSGSHLDGVDLTGVDLRGADMRRASLRQANLTRAQLTHADLSDAVLSGANLSHSNLLLTNFSGAELKGANLSFTTSSSEDALGHMRRGPRLCDADLQDTDFRNAYCCKSDFSGANLAGAQFFQAMLEGANLSKNDLTRVDLSDADLTHANLSDSNLTQTCLHGAQLIHADLQRAQMSNADISAANMQSSNLGDAKVDGIRYDRKTKFRGIRVSSCYGSSRFRRYAQDQDYIEEFKDAHPLNYWIWLVLTDCGRSMSLVILWSLGLTLIFALTFYLLGADAFEVGNEATLGWNLFTTLYYSIVTFTTLGFGDITPKTQLSAFFVMIEVVVGYLMLGILISILATKVARRS